MKHKFKVVLGILMLPIFIILYFLDRFVLLFIPWKSSHTIQKWIYDPKKAFESIIRVVAAMALIGLYYLIANIF